MAKEAVFTMKLEPELRDAFAAAAKTADRPASQIVREFMRNYVNQDREYVAWLQGRVDEARADIAAGRVRTQEEVEAHFVKRRSEWAKRENEADS